jgi:hypothetical protein
VQFVVMRFRFEVVDYVLPVGCQDVFVGTVEALVDLVSSAPVQPNRVEIDIRTFAQAPV